MSRGKIIGDYKYQIDCPIAKGAFSTVYRCVNLTTGSVHAVKVVDRAFVEANNMCEAVLHEIHAMELVASSKYLVNLVDKLVSSRNYYIVMDLVEGGTLLDFIQTRSLPVSVEWVRCIFRQLLSGLYTLHLSNIVHRDIKPENLLLNRDHTGLVISDFGFACYAPHGYLLQRACGTLRYCAPELLVQSPEYDGRKVDVWAAGVTLYVLLFNAHPFQGEKGDSDSLVESILGAKLSFPHPVSLDLEHLFSVMLQPVPSKRWSVRKLLRHVWVLGVDSALGTISSDGIENSATGGVVSTNQGFIKNSDDYLVNPALARVLNDDDIDPSSRQCRSCPILSKELNHCESSDRWSKMSGRSNDSINITITEDSNHKSGKSERSANISLDDLALNSPGNQICSPLSSPLVYRANRDRPTTAPKGNLIPILRGLSTFFFLCVMLVVVGVSRLLFVINFNELPYRRKIRSIIEHLLLFLDEKPSWRFDWKSLLGLIIRLVFILASGLMNVLEWGCRMVLTRAVATTWGDNHKRTL